MPGWSKKFNRMKLCCILSQNYNTCIYNDEELVTDLQVIFKFQQRPNTPVTSVLNSTTLCQELSGLSTRSYDQRQYPPKRPMYESTEQQVTSFFHPLFTAQSSYKQQQKTNSSFCWNFQSLTINKDGFYIFETKNECEC